MINKELKRLSRRELVDIIYQLKKNEQEMQEEIEKLRERREQEITASLVKNVLIFIKSHSPIIYIIFIFI